MPQKYQPNYRYTHEIYLSEIVFEKDKDSTDVTIFGYYRDSTEKKLKRVDYWCEFSTLTDLLMAGKEKCESVISAISDILTSETTEVPVIVDVENILGKPLKIDNIKLTIYRPMVEDENGEWQEDRSDEEFYIIDHFESFENKKSATRNSFEELFEYLTLLDNAFKYYLHLRSLDFTEETARKKSGLSDELLFRIAALNHKIRGDI